MPRPARRSKSRRAGYDEHHVTHLLDGVYLCPGHGFTTQRRNADGDFTDDAALREGWETLRDTLLPEFIAAHPGQRPYAWWKFDAPEPRQRTDGVIHPFKDPLRNAQVEQRSLEYPHFRDVAYKLIYGKPRCLFTQDDFAAQYEGELQYLDRLGLLTAEERAELYE